MTRRSNTATVSKAATSTGSVQTASSAGRKPTPPENSGSLIDRAPLTYNQQDFISSMIRAAIGEEPVNPRSLPIPDTDDGRMAVVAALADAYALSDTSSDGDVWRAYALAQQPDSALMVTRQNWLNANQHAAAILESFAGRDDRREALRAAAAKAKAKAEAAA